MSNMTRGQVIASAAEVYEEFYVPALFQSWATRVADAIAVRPDQRVLDVACGTGVLARALAERVGPGGAVIGLDINPAMLAVARQKEPSIEWRQGTAEQLPFDDASFDSVVCQFGLMFFEDRLRSIQEMIRVLRPGGRLGLAVWDTLENTPGYVAVVKLLEQMFGGQVAEAMRAPFVLGDIGTLRTLLTSAGLLDAEIATQAGAAEFPSLEAWVYTDVKGWTAADMIDDAGLTRLLDEAQRDLSRFVTAEGRVVFSTSAHLITATKAP